MVANHAIEAVVQGVASATGLIGRLSALD